MSDQDKKDLTAILVGVATGVVIVLSFAVMLWPNIERPSKRYSDGDYVEVNVRGERWGVFFRKKDDEWDKALQTAGAIGTTVCESSVIEVAPGLPYYVQRDTVLHELLHAATCRDGDVHNDYFNSTADGDHPGIERIASYTVTLLHENPELSHYLAGN